MLANSSNHSALSNDAPRRRTWLLVTCASLVTAALLLNIHVTLFSWESVVVVSGLMVVLALLLVVLSASRSREAWPEKILLLTWWVLLVSEEVFDPFVPTSFGVEAAENAFTGHFSFAAYGEAALWLLGGLISLLCILKRPEYIRGLWIKPYRWLVLFGLLCVASTTYTPQPLFAISWAFKLLVVILVVKASASFLQSSDRLASFFQATL